MIKYNIVLKDNRTFILASCDTEEQAKSRLQDMEATDLYLGNWFNWEKLPQYEIIKTEGEKEKNGK